MAKKTKKNIKVRDLKPKKDAKGGGAAATGATQGSYLTGQSLTGQSPTGQSMQTPGKSQS